MVVGLMRAPATDDKEDRCINGAGLLRFCHFSAQLVQSLHRFDAVSIVNYKHDVI